jgi:hypothetical protein
LRVGLHKGLPSRDALMCIAGIWAIFLCWVGRYEMLDDALIHLRYASVLHDRHVISFDGIRPNYGASSLLYVALLAVLRAITLSPLLPKLVSLLSYAALLAFAYRLARVRRAGYALILVLVGPFAIRWLTDGMETSPACVLSAVFAAMLHRKDSATALCLMALILSLLRVDLTLLVGFGVILLISQKEWLRAAALCIGSGLSLSFIELTMGHILPDTALAKEGLHFFGVLGLAAHEIAATFSFGSGLIALWIATALPAWRAEPRSAVICNLPFPALILLAATKGQQIQGIRYVLWALLFSIVWNLLMSARVGQWRPAVLAAFICALLVSWIIELPRVLRVDRGRASTLWVMEHGNLDRLHGEGLAADVGYLGYFSGAPLCDLSGLVNGRAAAIHTDSERAELCVASKPAFLFLSATQRGALDHKNHLNSHEDWIECGTVDFTNVNSDDRHWLMVRRTDYPKGCPTHL